VSGSRGQPSLTARRAASASSSTAELARITSTMFEVRRLAADVALARTVRMKPPIASITNTREPLPADA
jgi:hypothetical protein